MTILGILQLIGVMGIAYAAVRLTKRKKAPATTAEPITFDPLGEREPEPVPGTVPVQVPVTVPESEELPPPPPPPKSKREILYETAVDCLGIDMAPTQDVVGCAEALSFVLKKAGVKGLPKAGLVSTAELDKWLAKHLVKVTSPEPGDVIMSPTGSGNGTVRGHTGVVGKHKIMSNNSRTFLWDQHLTLDWWRGYYAQKGGLPVKFYRWE